MHAADLELTVSFCFVPPLSPPLVDVPSLLLATPAERAALTTAHLEVNGFVFRLVNRFPMYCLLFLAAESNGVRTRDRFSQRVPALAHTLRSQ